MDRLGANMMGRAAIFVPLLAFLSVAGCAGRDIDPPSLGPRAVERRPIALPDATAEPQVPTDAALAARIATIEEAARVGHAGFETTRARVAAAVAQAAGPGSESWTMAQQELSTLDTARGPLAHAAAEIDALRQDPVNSTSGNRAAIEAAATRIEALSAAEAEAFTTLERHLGP